jgi:hypothetical protein
LAAEGAGGRPAGAAAGALTATTPTLDIGRRMNPRSQTGSAAHAALVAAVAVLASIGVLITMAITLPLAFQEDTSAASAPLTRPATQAEAEVAIDEALAALQAGDEDAWRAALPASGDAADDAVDDLYDTLAGLPWTTLDATIDPIPSKPDRFDIRLTGALAGVGPDDRLVAERVLELRLLGTRVVATDDLTPKAVRDQYVMAYRDPMVVEGDACVVLTEPKYEDLAETLTEAAAEAHDDLGKLGIDPDRPVVLYLYASRDQLRDTLGGGPSDERFEFFSAAVERASGELWWPRDINVLAPALLDQNDWEDWSARLLAHELTHAFTVHWFADTAHDPMFLAEGLAVAVEGGRSYAPLREELAAGNDRLPLESAIAMGSLWSGNSQEKVELAYLEAGSVILYVDDEWGLGMLKRWVTAVADSDLTPDGLAAATRDTLGVGWDEFVDGWAQYVQTLP